MGIIVACPCDTYVLVNDFLPLVHERILVHLFGHLEIQIEPIKQRSQQDRILHDRWYTSKRLDQLADGQSQATDTRTQ